MKTEISLHRVDGTEVNAPEYRRVTVTLSKKGTLVNGTSVYGFDGPLDFPEPVSEWGIIDHIYIWTNGIGNRSNLSAPHYINGSPDSKFPTDSVKMILKIQVYKDERPKFEDYEELFDSSGNIKHKEKALKMLFCQKEFLPGAVEYIKERYNNRYLSSESDIDALWYIMKVSSVCHPPLYLFLNYLEKKRD